MIKHCDISKLFAVLLREEHPQKEFFQSRTDPFMHLGHFVQIAETVTQQRHMNM